MATRTSRSRYTNDEPHHPASIFPPTYKVVIVGKFGVGKTSLLWRYVHDEFRSLESRITIVDVEKKMINYADRQVELEFWDTAGTNIVVQSLASNLNTQF